MIIKNEKYPDSLNKALTILELLGFSVFFDRCFGNETIDVFVKKKKIFGYKLECWLLCITVGKRDVTENDIERLYSIRTIAREKLKKRSNDCQAVIISEKWADFTGKALETAGKYDIIVDTIDCFYNRLEIYKAQIERRIRNLKKMIYGEY